MRTFGYYASIYLKIKESELKHSSFEKYQTILDNAILPIFEKYQIDHIKPLDIRLWISSYNHLSPKTRRDYLTVLRGVFQEAFYDEVLDHNPVDKIRLPKLIQSDIQPFTPDEVNMILDAATGYKKNLYAFAFYTGMRTGEIIALRWDDIDLQKRLISVKRTRRKGIESSPKTLSSIRNIPIFDQLLPYIYNQLEITGKFRNYVFCNPNGKPFRDANSISTRSWPNHLKKLGILYRRLYNARHTFATFLLSKTDLSKNQISRILGHTTNQMLFQHYAKFIDGEMDSIDKSISLYDIEKCS